MRMIVPVVLLLFGATSVVAQPQTSGTPPVEPRAPLPAPVQPLPAATPVPVLPEPSNTSEASTRAEGPAAAEESQPEEPRKRSRMLWFLAGAVAVLAIILVAS